MTQQLQNIPATELKIDKSFVQNMHRRDSDRIMVQKTIEIGHELGMKDRRRCRNLATSGLLALEWL